MNFSSKTPLRSSCKMSPVNQDEKFNSEMLLNEDEKAFLKLQLQDDAFFQDFRKHAGLIEKSGISLEPRYTVRVLRALSQTRRRLTPSNLALVLYDIYHQDHTFAEYLLTYLHDQTTLRFDDGGGEIKPPTYKCLAEVETYAGLLLLVFLTDQRQTEKALKLSTSLVAKLRQLNKRSLDHFATRIYFYYSYVHELCNRLAEIRPVLLAAHKTAVLHHDEETQAVLINLLLRNFFHYGLYEQADKLVSKTVFPVTVNNNQLARYMYYVGRLKALQLDYSSAHANLVQASRKCTQSPVATGFLQSVNKFSVIVQLLMGEIPERALFRQPTMCKALRPYFHMTQAVRIGDLAKFQETVARYHDVFLKDKTVTLIQRLRHNVIKTGIRMISLSYSRISLKDVCLKLSLDSEQDAEYIVAKAIRDGVIDAQIDHSNGWLISHDQPDVYSTREPERAFNQRILFCLELHDTALRAMRYPTKSGEEMKEVEIILEKEREWAKVIEDSGDLGDMDDGDDSMGF